MQKYIINEINNQKTLFYYIKNFLDDEIYKNLKLELDNYNDWKFGYNYDGTKINRKQKWYQNNNHAFCKDWKTQYERWQSNKYTNNLLNLQNYVEDYVKTLLPTENHIQIPKYNSLLINYYEDGDTSITAHQDCKESFGTYPTIRLLSLGEERNIILERTLEDNLKRNKNENNLNKIFKLEDNSLFIIAGQVKDINL